MKSTGNFFKKINDFLNGCVAYIDERVRTGKFIDDIIYHHGRLSRFLAENSKKTNVTILHSKILFHLIRVSDVLWQALLKIPLFSFIISMLADTVKIIITCYSEIFIIFVLTFTTSIMLLNWFQTAIVFFFIAFIPILLFDIYCVSALYYFIDRREDKDKITLWESFLYTFRHFGFFSFPVITEAAIILEISIIYFIIGLFLSYVYDLFQLSWSGSLFYVFTIFFTGTFLLISIFIFLVIMHQIYFIVLLDHIPFQQALKLARSRLNTNPPYYLLFYLLLYLFCVIFAWKAILSYLYLGLTFGIFCTFSLGIFLGYLMRRRIHTRLSPNEYNLVTNQKIHLLFVIIIIFGIINYVLVAILGVQEYKPILAFVQQQQDDYLASQQIKQFTNDTYHYSLAYPQNWNVYQWDKKSITFYNNYTGTISGGTWMTITVSPYDAATFKPIYNSGPGVVNETQSEEIKTKVSDFLMQGYEGVTYTIIRTGIPYTKYETHYLIHKDPFLYDIAFTSVTNDVSDYNSNLFQKIVNSFKFIQ